MKARPKKKKKSLAVGYTGFRSNELIWVCAHQGFSKKISVILRASDVPGSRERERRREGSRWHWDVRRSSDA